MLESNATFALKVDFINGQTFYPIAPLHMEYYLRDPLASSYVMRMRRNMVIPDVNMVQDEGINVYLANRAKIVANRTDLEDEHIEDKNVNSKENANKSKDAFFIYVEKNEDEYLLNKKDMPAVVFHYGSKKLLATSGDLSGVGKFSDNPANISNYYIEDHGVVNQQDSDYQRQKENLHRLSFANMKVILDGHRYKEDLLFDLYHISRSNSHYRM
jgi:hypothetical protein